MVEMNKKILKKEKKYIYSDAQLKNILKKYLKL